MALPRPLWSDDDIEVARKVVQYPSSLVWDTWKRDPTKLAVVRAIVSCQVRLGSVRYFGLDMVCGLAQKIVCLLHSYPLVAEGVHY